MFMANNLIEEPNTGPTIIRISTVVSKASEFKCTFCDKKYTMRKNMLRHIRTNHSGGRKKNPKDTSNACVHCGRKFSMRKYMYRHIRKLHPEVADDTSSTNNITLDNSSDDPKSEDDSLKSKESVISCIHCFGRTFSTKRSLYRHIRRFHPDDYKDVKKPTNIICCLCDEACCSMEAYTNHISLKHEDIKLSFEKKTFYCDDDFQNWKLQFEEKTQSYFNLNWSKRYPDGRTTISYSCNRSGFYKPAGRGERKLKHIGSQKIGKTCPAYIRMNKNCVDDLMEIEVSAQSVHLGHELEVSRLRLPTKIKNQIAEQMMRGLPKSLIISNIKKKLPPKMKLSNKDLYNIGRKTNRDHTVSLHGNEIISEESEGEMPVDQEDEPVLLEEQNNDLIREDLKVEQLVDQKNKPVLLYNQKNGSISGDLKVKQLMDQIEGPILLYKQGSNYYYSSECYYSPS